MDVDELTAALETYVDRHKDLRELFNKWHELWLRLSTQPRRQDWDERPLLDAGVGGMHSQGWFELRIADEVFRVSLRNEFGASNRGAVWTYKLDPLSSTFGASIKHFTFDVYGESDQNHPAGARAFLNRGSSAVFLVLRTVHQALTQGESHE